MADGGCSGGCGSGCVCGTDMEERLREENQRLRAELKRLRSAQEHHHHHQQAAPQTLAPLPNRRDEAGPMPATDVRRYARQMTIAGFGAQGQRRLASAAVLVVGAGGLGSPALLYLAGAGVGRLGIVDGDAVEEGNLHRQVLHDTDRTGLNKAVSAQLTVSRLNPHIDVVAYPFRVTPANALQLVAQYDIVLDATDNVAARYILSDACVAANRPLVSGAALRADGQVAVYNYAGGPCYRCVHPTPPPPDTVKKADSAGVLGATVGVIGCLEAAEVIKILTGIGEPLSARMLMFSGFPANMRVLKLRGKQPGCIACGEGRSVDVQSFDYNAFCGAPWMPSDADNAATGMTCTELAKAAGWNAHTHSFDATAAAIVVDVRSAAEFSFCSIAGTTKHVPFNELQERLEEVTALATPGKQSAPLIALLLSSISSFTPLPCSCVCL